MNRLLGLLAISLMSLIACNKDAIELGVGLLDVESIGIFTDTIPVSLQTVYGDSLPTYRNTVFFDSRTHPLGRIEDPIFGNSEGIIYLGVGKGFGLPNFENTTLDSFVISIPFDSLARYGDLDFEQTIEVYQLEEKFLDFGVDTLYSDTTFMLGPLVGSTNVTARYGVNDTVLLNVPQGDTTALLSRRQSLRIPLEMGLGEAILADSNLIESDTTLAEFLKGFVLKSSGTTNSFMGLNLSNTGGSTLSIYYTNNEGAKRVYDFSLGDIRYINLAHDYIGSEIEQNIDLPDPEYTYIQSMAGTNIEVDLDSVKSLSGNLINRVQLEVTIASHPDDDTITYPPIENIFATYRNEDGNLQLISDISGLTDNQFELTLTNIEGFFGGSIVEVEENAMTYRKYFFNLTNHVNSIIDGDITNTKVTLVSFNKQERVNRSIIHNDMGNPETRPKLKVVLTEP